MSAGETGNGLVKDGEAIEDVAHDKHGIPIKVGDVLKVFHFVGARRKRHYMYKQVVGTRTLGPKAVPYLMVSHLNLKPADERDGGYYIGQFGQIEPDTEIVQSVDCAFEDRPRKAKGAA